MDAHRKLHRLLRFGAGPRLMAALVAGAMVFLTLSGVVTRPTQVLLAWDVGAIAYLLLAWSLIALSDATLTRERAISQDQSGYLIFLFVVSAACASIVSIGFMASAIKTLSFWFRAGHLVLSVLALMSSWLLIQTVFAFHYARRYYGGLHSKRVQTAELQFPGDREPDYMDFAYYAFVIGMTSQVSDVAVTSRPMRRLTLTHSFLSFVFNIAVLALSINIIASVL